MNQKRKIVLGLNLFNGISAIGGGIALITGVINQPTWLKYMDFRSLYFPGVILLAVVGGSAILAAITTFKSMPEALLFNVLSGLIMTLWIVVEICSIRGFHFLQLIYFITGIFIIWLTPKVRSNRSPSVFESLESRSMPRQPKQ